MSKPQKEQGKKKQFIIFGLCSVIALVLCMVTLVITVKQVEKDNNSASENSAVKESATVLENDFFALNDYALGLTKKTQNNKFVKISSYTDVSVDDSTVKVFDEGKENDKSIFLYAKNKIVPTVDSWYGEDYTGAFGTVYDKMPLVDLLGVRTTTARYTTGLADENGDPVYDDNGELVDEDYYYLTFNVDGNLATEKGFVDTFRTENVPETGDMLKKELSSVCDVANSEVTPLEFTVVMKINRFTDEIDYLEIARFYSVKADVVFIGDMSTFGEKSLEFTYKVTEHFDYYYAGIAFTNQSLNLDAGEEGIVSVNAVIEDDSDYTVKFTSSDDSVATVDEMGYVIAHKASDEPVYIIVTLQYMGEEFTDKCPVYVDNENS